LNWLKPGWEVINVHIKFNYQQGERYGWECLCGNSDAKDSFKACNSAGERVRNQEWDGQLYVCNRCGRIIDREGLAVVGVRADHSLTEAELIELYHELT
jgi:hypothetical protein